MAVYLNWRGPQGLETVDEFSPEPGQRMSAFRKYVSEMVGEYHMCGMAVYRSRRPCRDWGVKTSTTAGTRPAVSLAPNSMNEFVSHLREEHRVKLMTDYAYILKYGKLSLVAPKVWLDVLREHEALLPAGLVVQWVEFSNIEDTS